MASFDSSAHTAGTSSTSTTADNNGATDSTASIEGESVLDPDIPRLYVVSHDSDDDYDDGFHEHESHEHDDRAHYHLGTSLASSTATLTSLSAPAVRRGPTIFQVANNNDDSLRIPREPSYGNDNADGDDDGNEEDIEDGDEYDENDDLYDQLFDLQDPISRKAALATASALFAQRVGSSNIPLHKDDPEMDEVEKSFLRCTKPICSKKELISCLSSRSASPGPISPLLSDEDFPSLCSGSSSTAPSSRRSSDGSHTPRVRFKKGCVITAVNLTWAPTTYDRVSFSACHCFGHFVRASV